MPVMAEVDLVYYTEGLKKGDGRISSMMGSWSWSLVVLDNANLGSLERKT